MKGQIFKNKTDFENLKLDLLRTAKIKMERIGKRPSWLRYAKKTAYGYRFLSNKQAQWKILGQIANEVADRHKSFTQGEVVDILSELVNK